MQIRLYQFPYTAQNYKRSSTKPTVHPVASCIALMCVINHTMQHCLPSTVMCVFNLRWNCLRQPHAPVSSSHDCILTIVTYLHPEELLTPKAVNSHLPKTHSSHLHSWRTPNLSWAVWGLNQHSGHHCFWRGVSGFLPQLFLGESFFSDWDVDFHFNPQKLGCAVSSCGSHVLSCGICTALFSVL